MDARAAQPGLSSPPCTPCRAAAAYCTRSFSSQEVRMRSTRRQCCSSCGQEASSQGSSASVLQQAQARVRGARDGTGPASLACPPSGFLHGARAVCAHMCGHARGLSQPDHRPAQHPTPAAWGSWALPASLHEFPQPSAAQQTGRRRGKRRACEGAPLGTGPQREGSRDPNSHVSPQGSKQASQSCCQEGPPSSAWHSHTPPLEHAGSC